MVHKCTTFHMQTNVNYNIQITMFFSLGLHRRKKRIISCKPHFNSLFLIKTTILNFEKKIQTKKVKKQQKKKKQWENLKALDLLNLPNPNFLTQLFENIPNTFKF